MAKINNTSAYAPATPTADSIVIGSTESGGDTKNFQMSDIANYISGLIGVPTLQEVCDEGNTTTTSIQINNIGGLSILTGPLTSNGPTFLLGSSTVINGTVDINNTADISGNTTIGGTLGVTGVSTLGEIDASGVADIADTLTLSKASGNGLDVVSDANIGGKLITNTIEADTGNLVLNDSASIERLRLTAAGGFVFQGTVSFAQAAPSSSTSTGSTGQIALDTNYIYVCVGANSWGRVAIDTTPF
jgi:hypothetical protein